MTGWRIGFVSPSTTVGSMFIGLLLAGCARQPSLPQPPPQAAAAPATSYDGFYQGAVRLTGAGAGVPGQGCATSPAIMLQVTNDAFTYTQPHPAVLAPGLGTTSYTVAIAPDGGFSGHSTVGGTMIGTITGSHMAGTIDGVECVYSFSADRK